MTSRSVADLKKGERAVIKTFRDRTMSLKLLEMGCLPGTEIRLDAVAPFGDPICVNIGGYYCLALRRDEAASIEVE